MYLPEIHHRRSTRLSDYDYAQPGAYFITICTQGRICLFGDVKDGEILLNPLGRIAKECWMSLPQHFNRVSLDLVVVMPNHVHGIVRIAEDGRSRSRGTACRAPTMERFSHPDRGSLPTIIRSFKSSATKRINELRSTQGAQVWQRNYYDRVIRNERELDAIRQYLVDNPEKWPEDKENPQEVTGYS